MRGQGGVAQITGREMGRAQPETSPHSPTPGPFARPVADQELDAGNPFAHGHDLMLFSVVERAAERVFSRFADREKAHGPLGFGPSRNS